MIAVLVIDESKFHLERAASKRWGQMLFTCIQETFVNEPRYNWSFLPYVCISIYGNTGSLNNEAIQTFLPIRIIQ